VNSPASCTEEWLPAVWGGYYDLTYISSNPYVNSIGRPCRDYVAKDHFKRIIDVWKFGWCEKLGTVPPSAVNEVAMNMTNRSTLVIHYAQPHWPYIGKTKILYPRPMSPLERARKPNILQHLLNRLKRKILTWQVLRSGKLRDAYFDNLRLVLEYVTKLIPHLNGKVVITADHGDLLGEHERLWHPCEINHPVLREVPWFEVD